MAHFLHPKNTVFLQVGDNQLSSQQNADLPFFTADQIALQLTDGYWDNTNRSARSFDIAVGGSISVNISNLTTAGQSLAYDALQTWSAVTGLTFIQTTEPAHIVFDDEYSGAYAQTYTTGSNMDFAFINIGTSWIDYYGYSLDSYSFQTYIHEIGHALGLGHAGNYNGAADYGEDNHYTNDSWQATIMSYFSQTENTTIDADYAYIMTPMVADVVAIRNLYGTTSQNLIGDTVYGQGSNAGSIYDHFVTSSNATSVTIVDDGGIDTINFFSYSSTHNIDLREEGISDVGGLKGNLSISRGSIIENATTGSGDDSIIGNQVDNILTGNGGDDYLDGGAGEDTAVFSGNRADYSIVFNAAENAYIVSHISGVSNDGTDTLVNIEFAQFADELVNLQELDRNLLINGSFENPEHEAGTYNFHTSIEGWTAVDGGEIEIWNDLLGFKATDGEQHLELDVGDAVDGLYQDVQTQIGQSYELSFDARLRNDKTTENQTIQILWNDEIIATFRPEEDWSQYTFNVIGTGGEDRLTVQELASETGGSAGTRGSLLDNFSLIATGEPNTPPVANDDIHTGTFDENLPGEFDITQLLSNDTDADGDNLSIIGIVPTPDIGSDNIYYTESGAQITYLENDGSIHYSANGAFGHLSEGETVTETFSYIVSDGNGGTDTASVSFTVVGTNQGPIVSNPIVDQDATENEAFSFTLPEDTFYDRDQLDTLELTAKLEDGSNLPAWLSFIGTTFIGTPPDGSEGTLNIRITANDGSETVSDVFELNIADDDVPPPPAGNLLINGSFENPEHEAGTYNFHTSIEGWTAIDGGEIEIWNDLLGFKATDGEQHLELDVGDAVDGLYQDVQTQIGQSYELSFDARLRNDKTTENQTIQILWNDEIIATFRPEEDWSQYTFNVIGTGGEDRLTVQELASETGGSAGTRGSLLDNFSLIATGEPNTPPVANDDTLPSNIDEDTAGFGWGHALLLANDTDADEDALTIIAVDEYSAMGSHVDLESSNGYITVTNTSAYQYLAVGETVSDSFSYTISDGNGGTSTATATFTITGANDTPIVSNPIVDQDATENEAFSFTLPADAFSDVDATDTLEFTATLEDGSDLPAWLSFDGTVFTGIPPEGSEGTLNIRVTANDGSETVSDVFELNIADDEVPPPASATRILFDDAFADGVSAWKEGSAATPTVENGEIDVVGGSWSQAGFRISGGQAIDADNAILELRIFKEAGSAGYLRLRDTNGKQKTLDANNSEFWSLDGETGQSGTNSIETGTWYTLRIDLDGIGISNLANFAIMGDGNGNDAYTLDDAAIFNAEYGLTGISESADWAFDDTDEFMMEITAPDIMETLAFAMQPVDLSVNISDIMAPTQTDTENTMLSEKLDTSVALSFADVLGGIDENGNLIDPIILQDDLIF